jgi:hypothetical protein
VKEEEDRLKVLRDNRDFVLTKRKLSDGEEFEIDVGFLDDAKDKVKGYLHVITFYNDKKREVSRIVIQFDKEGNYLINGEKHGNL